MSLEQKIEEAWRQYENPALEKKAEAKEFFEDRAVWLAQQYMAQQSIIKNQAEEIERLKHIAGLLASQIDISNEVFDALSMEDDYEFYSSKAKKGESPC